MKKPVNIPVLMLAVGLICLLVYLRALSCGFVNYDDPDYILDNPLIRHLDLNFLISAFTSSHVGWWMPLTWISLAVDYHFWGLNPLGYHLTNIVLHGANGALVVLTAHLLCRDRFLSHGGTGSNLPYRAMLLLAGLLFGLHPLRVESVAWVTERKDVLNGLFTLSSVIFYLLYAGRHPESGRRGILRYGLSLLLFACSLMAKSVSVVLPVMLLLLDWYPLERFRREAPRQLLLEKAPFLLLSVAMAIATFVFTARSSYLVSWEAFPFSQRLVVSGTALFEYCRLLIYPVGILPYHMIPSPIPGVYVVKGAVSLILAGCCLAGVRRNPAVTATWALFLLPLLPVLAFFQNGDQSYAARFTYLPSVAPSIAAAAAIFVIYRALPSHGLSRKLLPVALAVLLAIHAGITQRLIDVFRSPEAFWSRVIDLEPEVVALKERGRLFHEAGRYDAAIGDFSAAIAMANGVFRDTIYNLYAFRGDSLRAAGRLEEAVRDFNAAIALLPHPAYFYYRGQTLAALGRMREAAEDFRRAGAEKGPLLWY